MVPLQSKASWTKMLGIDSTRHCAFKKCTEIHVVMLKGAAITSMESMENPSKLNCSNTLGELMCGCHGTVNS